MTFGDKCFTGEGKTPFMPCEAFYTAFFRRNIETICGNIFNGKFKLPDYPLKLSFCPYCGEKLDE